MVFGSVEDRVHGHCGNPDQIKQDWQSSLCRNRSSAVPGAFDSGPRSCSISKTTSRSRTPGLQHTKSLDRVGGESKATASHVEPLFGCSAVADAVPARSGLSVTHHVDAAGRESCFFAEREPPRPKHYAMSEIR